MFLTLHLWHEPESILELAGVCAFGRTEQDGESVFAPQREHLQKAFPRARVTTITLPGLVDISSTRLRELLAAALDLLRHCTVNQFEVWRNGERMTALPVLILILLVLVAYWISLPLLVVGLFFGCKYRFSGPDLDKNRVGEVVNQVSAKVGDAVDQVRDEFKREFGKSRGKKGK